MNVRGGWGGVPDDEARIEARRAASRGLVRRSTIMVPANVPAFVAKAHLRGADVVVIDLEDSIPPDQKTNAREAAREAIKLVGRGGADVLVRVNKPFAQAVLDLDAIVVPGLSGLKVAKVETAAEIRILDALLLERELAAGMEPGSVDLTIALENARGLFNATEIFGASARTAGVNYGEEDVTEELGIELSASGDERFFGNARTILAAAAFGIQPLGRIGKPFDYSDVEGTEQTARRGAALGFKGATCIHPAQVAPLNRGFTPPAEAVERARAIVTVMNDAIAAGRASASYQGRMVDIPSLRRARGILDRMEAIDARERRKAEALALLGG